MANDNSWFPVKRKQRSQTNPSGANVKNYKHSQKFQAIPAVIANRMLLRIGLATGIPTLTSVVVLVASYILVSNKILEISPGITLAISGACFIIGLLGFSYGILSTSWDVAPGSVLGFEQILINIRRLRNSNTD
uniref:DUF3464 family protein n=1 Tax=Paulinella chromatophora TaxID=39717 RepID=B1X415_PAUCH|nr:hypothetical protein PCC_0235 [Paulinella chromatophora]ACB42684.1 hypothetical protein PCC_0235 [Paulinella chromatophora]